jgi:hypothetical protein
LELDVPKSGGIEKIEPHRETNTLICHNLSEPLPEEPFPRSFIVKEAWPLAIRTQEGSMYKDASGSFGVPEFILSYRVEGPRGPHSTADMLPSDVTYWNVVGRPSEPKPESERRNHYRYLFKTEGHSLYDASSPRELLEGILHAAIGAFPE